ncbi:leucine-rich repeat domain-containing protein [Roseivivax sediminis]|uniref:Leucine Rich repeat-containing protein n=1 Tax=Roseivivax sediminis TaxID=936889 RepID=A0A1I2DT30_9RHOB|nr:leucine-rich repeat domain-containing protein [Roseivivax sediminis]SFE83421.1 hypothetical protein SAMN04515678_11832 [Roseivivax sediminis]
MSDADAAFAKAEEMIEEATRDGAERLSFDLEEMRAFDRLPARIAEARTLRRIELDKTQVSDLAPLSGLTALRGLWLNGTQASELAALSEVSDLYRLGQGRSGLL